jgi:DNA-directed RNA polymerase specialized sigma24 family protein
MTKDGYGQAYQGGFQRTVRFLLGRGLRCDMASEVAQAAWARGWERRSQLRNETMVLTWINTIALNVYRGLLRSELHREVCVVFNAADAIDVAAIDATTILNLCPPRDRALLERYMNGFTSAEIAGEQNATETAVRIRLMRALRAARRRVQRNVLHPLKSIALSKWRREAA